jgi:hypothetical protein
MNTMNPAKAGYRLSWLTILLGIFSCNGLAVAESNTQMYFMGCHWDMLSEYRTTEGPHNYGWFSQEITASAQKNVLPVDVSELLDIAKESNYEDIFITDAVKFKIIKYMFSGVYIYIVRSGEREMIFMFEGDDNFSKVSSRCFDVNELDWKFLGSFPKVVSKQQDTNKEDVNSVGLLSWTSTIFFKISINKQYNKQDIHKLDNIIKGAVFGKISAAFFANT